MCCGMRFSYSSVGGRDCFPKISEISGPITKIPTSFDSMVRDLSEKYERFYPKAAGDDTCQPKIEIFNFPEVMDW